MGWLEQVLRNSVKAVIDFRWDAAKLALSSLQGWLRDDKGLVVEAREDITATTDGFAADSEVVTITSLVSKCVYFILHDTSDRYSETGIGLSLGSNPEEEDFEKAFLYFFF